MLISNETRNREPDDDTFSLYLRLAVLCVALILALLLVSAFLIAKHLTAPPSFVEPRVIANGKKYEPRPVPMRPEITKEVIEKSEYEVLY